MALHNEIGTLGEDYAAKLLTEKGYRILERNWRLGHLEMDIICESNTELVFVEVKTRTSYYAGRSPESYVDADKQRHMVSAGNAYMRYHKITDKTLRFDIVGILVADGEIKACNHYEDAFHPHVRTIHASSYSGEWRHHSLHAYTRYRKK